MAEDGGSSAALRIPLPLPAGFIPVILPNRDSPSTIAEFSSVAGSNSLPLAAKNIFNALTTCQSHNLRKHSASTMNVNSRNVSLFDALSELSKS